MSFSALQGERGVGNGSSEPTNKLDAAALHQENTNRALNQEVMERMNGISDDANANTLATGTPRTAARSAVAMAVCTEQERKRTQDLMLAAASVNELLQQMQDLLDLIEQLEADILAREAEITALKEYLNEGSFDIDPDNPDELADKDMEAMIAAHERRTGKKVDRNNADDLRELITHLIAQREAENGRDKDRVADANAQVDNINKLTGNQNYTTLSRESGMDSLEALRKEEAIQQERHELITEEIRDNISVDQEIEGLQRFLAENKGLEQDALAEELNIFMQSLSPEAMKEALDDKEVKALASHAPETISTSQEIASAEPEAQGLDSMFSFNV